MLRYNVYKLFVNDNVVYVLFHRLIYDSTAVAEVTLTDHHRCKAQYYIV